MHLLSKLQRLTMSTLLAPAVQARAAEEDRPVSRGSIQASIYEHQPMPRPKITTPLSRPRAPGAPLVLSYGYVCQPRARQHHRGPPSQKPTGVRNPCSASGRASRRSEWGTGGRGNGGEQGVREKGRHGQRQSVNNLTVRVHDDETCNRSEPAICVL